MGLLVVGCKAKSALPPPALPKANVLQQTIESGAGSTELFSPTKTSQRLWKVEWKSASVTARAESKEGMVQMDPDSGIMNEVTGEVDDDQGVASTFRGDRAEADKAEQVLALTGKVVVISKRKNGKLTCDRLEWLPKRKRYHAVGNVVATGPVGTLGPFPEIWATPDLKKVSTP